MKTVKIDLGPRIAHIPYDVIARHKASLRKCSVSDVMIDFDSDHYEAVDWLQNNMALGDFINKVQFWASKTYNIWDNWVDKVDKSKYGECIDEKSPIQILDYVHHCAKRFISKVEMGQAKSTETYNDMQEIVRLINGIQK